MTEPQRSSNVSRALGALHVAFAVAAFGIGNATFTTPNEAPAVAHLILGVMLVVTAFGLWRQSSWTRWAIALNVAASLIVALTFLGDVVSRSSGDTLPVGLAAAAVAFAAIELLTMRHASAFGSSAPT